MGLEMRLKIIGCSGAEFPGHNSPCFFLPDNEIISDAGSVTTALDEKTHLKIRNVFIAHA
jgi:hypothetical protein